VNATLALLKWPAAFAAVLLLPAIAVAWFGLASTYMRAWPVGWPFVAGALLFVVTGALGWRSSVHGGFLSTFEHEVTHALFAWLTFHRVTGFHATGGAGGMMRYRGEGNWLITIAPYWFPTIPVFVIIAFGWGQAPYLPWAAGLLGVTFAHHAANTIRETHRGQADLRQVGWPFAAAFLPAANLAAAGAVVAFAFGGLGELVGFACAVGDAARMFGDSAVTLADTLGPGW